MKRPAGLERQRERVRLWLRLLKCTRLIEARVRGRLREDFSTTLPRFDMLAQLDAAGAHNGSEGLTMSELSDRLMVSNGNVTGLAERLVRERLITRSISKHDRRSQRLRLTAAGQRTIARLARDHRAWITEMFAEIGNDEAAKLSRLLTKLRRSVEEVAR